MKKILIEFRHYCYHELMIQKDQEYAEQSYQFLFTAALYPYYISFLSILAVGQWQLKIPVPYVFKHNFLVILFTAILMNVPFYFMIRWLLERLSAVPLTREMSNRQFILLRWKALVIYCLGLALMFLIPWVLTEIFNRISLE